MLALQDAANGSKDEEGQSKISGLARGIAFQMVEKMGTVPRRLIAEQFKDVDKEGRFQLKKLGVWLGATSLYVPALLKPHAAQLRLLLWAVYNEKHRLPTPPAAGLCTVKIDSKAPRAFYEVSGYRVVGENGVRLDMLERLANTAREIAQHGPFEPNADLMSLVGCSGTDFEEIMRYLGYRLKDFKPEEAAKIQAERAEKVAKETAAKDAKTPDKVEENLEEKPALDKSATDTPAEEKAPQETTSEETKPEDAVTKDAGNEGTTTEDTPPSASQKNTSEDETEDAATIIQMFVRTPPRRHRGTKGAGNRGRSKPHSTQDGKTDAKAKGDKPAKARRSHKPHPKRTRKPEPQIDADSPFAVLQDLKRSMGNKK